jgi:hypothetical protein
MAKTASQTNPMHTLAHVTHEAVEQLGGIGTVLEGLITSPAYQKRVRRNILIGPLPAHKQTKVDEQLGEHGQVLYSSKHGLDQVGLGAKLRPLQWAFDVDFVYGRRRFDPPGQGRIGEAEVLLVDVTRPNQGRLNEFKGQLYEIFRLESARYERHWDFEEYARLAEPAYYALQALLGQPDYPCILFSHEFMGLPTAFRAVIEGDPKILTLFHAHECATARRLVENHPGHDAMFYNVMKRALKRGRYVEDVFGDLDMFFRHALIRRTHRLGAILAVGDYTREEIRFLGPEFENHHIDIVYNGVPAAPVSLQQKKQSRAMLAEYAQTLLNDEPDVLLTHVTRPVVSKAMWRDMRICHELSKRLASDGKSGALFILTSAGGTRAPHDIARMENDYGWPRHHREGFPDLVGPEIDIHRDVERFNQEHNNFQVVLVNQFGWSPERIGARLPEGMDIADLRRATDVELGTAIYEPFGISPLEPLGCGAVCVISNVCGCAGFINRVTNGKRPNNIVTADYIKLEEDRTLEELLAMGQRDREEIDQRVSAEVAHKILQALPTTDKATQAMIDEGQKLVAKMGWDQIVEDQLMPVLDRLRANLPPGPRSEAIRSGSAV